MIPQHHIAQLPWSASFIEDKRFRQLAVACLVLSLVFGVIVPIIKLPKIDRETIKKTQENIVKIKIKQPPKVEIKKPELTAEQLEALRRAEEERLKKLEEERKKRLEEQKKREEEERKRREEEERKRKELDAKKQEDLAKKREEDRKRQEELAKKREEDRKRQEELAKQRAEEERVRQEALAKQRAAEEAARKAEAERQRVATEKAKAKQMASDLFGGLADDTPAPKTATSGGKLTSSQNIQSAAPAGGNAPNLIARATGDIGKGSGGISTQNLRTVEVGSGAALAQARATQIEEIDLGVKGGDSSGGGGGGSAADSAARGRSERELNGVLERYKTRMTQIYQRALRADPSLGGKVVLKITIAPSGEVTDVQVVSTDIKDDAFLSKLKALIKTVQFDPKDVGTVVAKYPIDFNL